jgi:hypothetical protein
MAWERELPLLKDRLGPIGFGHVQPTALSQHGTVDQGARTVAIAWPSAQSGCNYTAAYDLIDILRMKGDQDGKFETPRRPG